MDPSTLLATHPVTPHSQILPFAPGIWYVVGSLKRSPVPRNMVIYRLPSGGLLIHSAIALDEATIAELEKLGAIEYVIVPSPIHRLDAAWYHAKFPKAKFLCPDAAVKKASEVVDIFNTCEEILPSLGIKAHIIEGIKPVELCYELTSPDGSTFLFCDCLMNLEHISGMQGSFLRLLGSTGFFGITRIGRLFLLQDKKAFREFLMNLSKHPKLHSVIVAHGDPIRVKVRERLQAAAERL